MKKVKPFNTTIYKGLAYVTRTFKVILEGESETITIAIDTLSEALGGEKLGHVLDKEADAIDEQIYFYLEGEKITLSGKEICEQHLDEPMKFVREIF